jgi:hypothetical protein
MSLKRELDSNRDEPESGFGFQREITAAMLQRQASAMSDTEAVRRMQIPRKETLRSNSGRLQLSFYFRLIAYWN